MNKISLNGIEKKYKWITESNFYVELKDEIENESQTQEEILEKMSQDISCYVFDLKNDRNVKKFIDTILFWHLDEHLSFEIMDKLRELNHMNVILECTNRIDSSPETKTFLTKFLIISTCFDCNRMESEKFSYQLASEGFLDVLQYLQEKTKKVYLREILVSSAKSGKLNVFKHYFEKFKKSNQYLREIIDTAILHYRMNILTYLENKDYDLSEPKYLEASLTGTDLEIIKYLFEKVEKPSITIHLEIFELFSEEKFDWIFKNLVGLDQRFYYDIMVYTQCQNLKYFEKYGYKPDVDICIDLLSERYFDEFFILLDNYPELRVNELYNELISCCYSLEYIQKMKEYDLTHDQETFYIATLENCDLKIIKYLNEDSCYKDERVFRNCLINENNEAIEYCVKNNFPIDEQDWMNINNPSLIQYYKQRK